MLHALRVGTAAALRGLLMISLCLDGFGVCFPRTATRRDAALAIAMLQSSVSRRAELNDSCKEKTCTAACRLCQTSRQEQINTNHGCLEAIRGDLLSPGICLAAAPQCACTKVVKLMMM